MTLREARELYLSHLDAERGCTSQTIVAYRSDLRQFIRHQSSGNGEPLVEGVDADSIRQFILALRARGLSMVTISRRISCLRSFFDFLDENDYATGNPSARIRVPKKGRKLPVTLTEDECRALLDAAYERHFTALGFRDRAVLSLLVYTGIRRQELLDLELGDVDLEESWLRVRRGKGNKTRMVPLVPEAVWAVEDWLEFRPPCAHLKLFATLARKPLGRHGLYSLFARALAAAGISKPGITLHCLRHTFASLLLRNGCDLMSIKEMLGHASLASTAIYLHVDVSSLRGAIIKHPLAAQTR